MPAISAHWSCPLAFGLPTSSKVAIELAILVGLGLLIFGPRWRCPPPKGFGGDRTRFPSLSPIEWG